MIEIRDMTRPKRVGSPSSFNALPVIALTRWSDTGWSLYLMWLQFCLRIWRRPGMRRTTTVAILYATNNWAGYLQKL